MFVFGIFYSTEGLFPFPSNFIQSCLIGTVFKLSTVWRGNVFDTDSLWRLIHLTLSVGVINCKAEQRISTNSMFFFGKNNSFLPQDGSSFLR